MSYINDALKKAQQEKDGRYRRYDGIISGLPGPRSRRRRTWLVAAVSMMLVLAALSAWLTVTGRPERPVVATQIRHDKIITAGHPQVQTAGRESEVVPAVRTAAVDALTPAKEAAQTGPKKPAARFAGKEAAASVRPSVPKPFPDPGMLYGEALAAQQNKKTEVAERLYRRILTLDTQHIKAMNNLGVLLMGQGRQEQAVTLFHKAIAMKKDYVDPHYNLACLYAQRNDAAKSMAYLKSAIAIDRSAIDWAKTDADLSNINNLDDYKKLMETQH
jgi:Flp pilus assembly protein TadD